MFFSQFKKYTIKTSSFPDPTSSSGYQPFLLPFTSKLGKHYYTCSSDFVPLIFSPPTSVKILFPVYSTKTAPVRLTSDLHAAQPRYSFSDFILPDCQPRLRQFTAPFSLKHFSSLDIQDCMLMVSFLPHQLLLLESFANSSPATPSS